ncbi:hypothetical protein F994_02011 [Acinetobacter bohemicus ANC 3994]|uniref:Uncharacterized protein n=1 Tax=Acinetobacter bohemicus ANC 3994 TaxID=1217715 RepID=N8NYC3_9GAMM|nr:hypothetical protein [Acinetobacter bohemicus]ENU19155.1 hypothetical protein F994_02011 [Acinetobacter bohemicus ANC 3994]
MSNREELKELFIEIRCQINLYLNSASRLDFYKTGLDSTYNYLMDILKISIPSLEKILSLSNDLENFESCNIAIDSLVVIRKKITNEVLSEPKNHLFFSLKKMHLVAENLEKIIQNLESLFYEEKA